MDHRLYSEANKLMGSFFISCGSVTSCSMPEMIFHTSSGWTPSGPCFTVGGRYKIAPSTSRNNNIPYSRKYWRSINLAVWPPRRYVVILAEFKFGGLSTTSHRRLCIANILAELNLAVRKRIAKPPNLNHRQIFRLYGMHARIHDVT